MAPNSSQNVETGATILTPTDWQSVMEGVLHTNDQQGREQIESALRYFHKEGKLPTFIHKLEEMLQYAREEQKSNPDN